MLDKLVMFAQTILGFILVGMICVPFTVVYILSLIYIKTGKTESKKEKARKRVRSILFIIPSLLGAIVLLPLVIKFLPLIIIIVIGLLIFRYMKT